MFEARANGLSTKLSNVQFVRCWQMIININQWTNSQWMVQFEKGSFQYIEVSSCPMLHPWPKDLDVGSRWCLDLRGSIFNRMSLDRRHPQTNVQSAPRPFVEPLVARETPYWPAESAEAFGGAVPHWNHRAQGRCGHLSSRLRARGTFEKRRGSQWNGDGDGGRGQEGMFRGGRLWGCGSVAYLISFWDLGCFYMLLVSMCYWWASSSIGMCIYI